MAKELQAFLDPSLTIYAVLLNNIGQIYNTSSVAFEIVNAVNWTDYDIAMTESTAGIYFGNIPTVIAGIYSYVVYKRAGITPAITDEIKGIGTIAWDGSAEVILSTSSQIADAVLDELIGDSTITLRQALKVMIAAFGGKSSGGGTTTIKFRNTADNTDVIVATVDANGNRSAVTLTV